MFNRCLLLLAAWAPYGIADVHFTQPEAGSIIGSGMTLRAIWEESGADPPLTHLTSYNLILCAGGNHDNDSIELEYIVQNGKLSAGNSASTTVKPDIGGAERDAYYLKMVSRIDSETIINYSNRFSLDGMTGTFPSNVEAGIRQLAGTDGPISQGNMEGLEPPMMQDLSSQDTPEPELRHLDLRQAVAPAAAAPAAAPAAADPANAQAQAAPAAAAVPGAAAAPAAAPAAAAPADAAGAFTVPFSLQTGLTRYAPMPKRPGTKITAQTASAQFPTTNVNIAKTYLPLPTPLGVTTITQSYTGTLPSSVENPASAAPAPQDKMQKFLNRWKD